MNTKQKVLLGTSLIISAVVLAGIAFASDSMMNTSTTTMPSTTMPSSTMMQTPKPMVLTVSNSGKVLLRGTIQSVSSGTMTVATWGGTWTINAPSSTTLMPSDMTQFKMGDFVGVQGMVNQTSSWTVDATFVRDWTAESMMMKNDTMMK